MGNRRPEQLSGRVKRQQVRPGTAGEHSGLVLHTDDGEELILQRISANPFQDPETAKLEGRQVTVAGHRLGKTFRYLTVTPETE